MYDVKNEEEKKIAKKFAKLIYESLRENLKVTFQNDFVLDIG